MGLKNKIFLSFAMLSAFSLMGFYKPAFAQEASAASEMQPLLPQEIQDTDPAMAESVPESPSQDVLSEAKPEPQPDNAESEILQGETDPMAQDPMAPTMDTDPSMVSQTPEEFDENLFFDAQDVNVPEGAVVRPKGQPPTNVNPLTAPGTSIVITGKTFDAGSAEARLISAERATKLGRLESALQIYDQLYAENAADPNVLVGRAITLQRLGRDAEAIIAYEELLNAKPNNLEAHVNMQGLLAKRYPAVALRNLMDLDDQNPGNISIISQIAVVEAQLGNYPEAIRYLGVAASMQPTNATHLFNMAIIADRAGSRDQAISYYEEALEVDTLYGAGRSIPREAVFQRLAELR